VVISSVKEKRWFLPRGRKDIGESLEQAALREAYEEVSSFILHFRMYLMFPPAPTSDGISSRILADIHRL
jgi:8-oxo-dGTP pyrophosphatase MutT (NUDIX family)